MTTTTTRMDNSVSVIKKKNTHNNKQLISNAWRTKIMTIMIMM